MNQEFSPTNHSLKLIAANKGLSKVDDFWKKTFNPETECSVCWLFSGSISLFFCFETLK